MAEPLPRQSDLMAQLEPYGQTHLLEGWEQLTSAQQMRLAEQICSLDLLLLKKLAAEAQHPSVPAAAAIEPPQVLGLPQTFEELAEQQAAAEAGEAFLDAGKIAVVLVAGGQGSRLGHEGPKGTFTIGPVTSRCLFQIHAEKVLARSRRHGKPIPLLIMTSPENDAVTRTYFRDLGYFGLDESQVTFFQQGMLPALDAETGAILRSGPDQIAFSPNGHGGTLEALHRGGHLQALRDGGVEALFYFQVDNPLVKVADPEFVGQCLRHGAELGVKVVRKTDPNERIGLVVERGGKQMVIEYSELGADLAEARDASGGLRFWAGSTAIHFFRIDFLLRLADAETMLPYHVARKVMPVWRDGEITRPDQPNAHKFEMFIFDALPLARKALVVETPRAEEFEPLKNAEGDYSPATVRRAMSELAAGWLRHAGVPVADEDVAIEISPLFALDAEELRGKVDGLGPVQSALVLGPDFISPPDAEAATEEPE